MGMDTSGLRFPKSNTVDDRDDRKREKRSAEEAARAAVWLRDKSHDRATGKPLKKGGIDPDTRGECHHLQGRNVAPAMREKAEGMILLSAHNHILADGRGGYRLKMFDPKTGEPATDGSKPILFVMFKKDGTEDWRRIS